MPGVAFNYSGDNRIAIGTAQFGLDYGITNKLGRVSRSDVAEILTLAKKWNVDVLDTASVYGDSEEILGGLNTEAFRIVTKLPAIQVGTRIDASWVVSEAIKSATNLRRPRVSGLLVHSPEDLRGVNGAELVRGLQLVKERGLAEKIGVSIYDPGDLEWISELLKLDLVQAPFNVFDRRILQSGWLERLTESGVELHTRSVFLQGALLTGVQNLPSALKPWASKFSEFEDWAGSVGLRLPEAAILCPLSVRGIGKVVVGFLSSTHLEEVLRVNDIEPVAFPDFGVDDPGLINPVNWAK